MLIVANADRFGTGRPERLNGVVVHTTESAESLAGIQSLMTRAGDRPRENPTEESASYGSSYDAIANPDGTWDTIELGGGDGYPYAAPPLNRYWLHIVMPGSALQADNADGWRDTFSLGCIRAVARYIVAMSKIHGFPLVKRTPNELLAMGVEDCTGYAGHGDVDQAWHKSAGHFDPGPNFPWDLLATEIRNITNPTPERKAAAMWTVCDVIDSDVSLLVMMDDNGIGGMGKWLRTPEKRQAHIDLGAPVTNRSVDSFGNVTLVGPLPVGDRFHEWTGAEFDSVGA